MTGEQMKEVDAHLAEYKAIRDEMQLSIRRIDTLTGLYLAGLFAIVAYLLRPCAEGQACGTKIRDLMLYVSDFRSSPTVSAYLLVFVVLNSVFLIRTANSVSHILALASYNVNVLRPRLKTLLGAEVLSWDAFSHLIAGPLPLVDPKSGWLAISGIDTFLEFGLAESLSFLFLWIVWGVPAKPVWLTALVVLGASVFSISIICVFVLYFSGSTFPAGTPKVLDQDIR